MILRFAIFGPRNPATIYHILCVLRTFCNLLRMICDLLHMICDLLRMICDLLRMICVLLRMICGQLLLFCSLLHVLLLRSCCHKCDGHRKRRRLLPTVVMIPTRGSCLLLEVLPESAEA